MNPIHAAGTARTLMNVHNLENWRFRWTNAKVVFGKCSLRKKTIYLSKPLVILNDEAQVTDTILHEIAHALTPGQGHNFKWRAVAKAIGANPNRCYDSKTVVTPEAPYLAYCPTCDREYKRHRVPRDARYCGVCYKTIMRRVPRRVSLFYRPEELKAAQLTFRRASEYREAAQRAETEEQV